VSFSNTKELFTNVNRRPVHPVIISQVVINSIHVLFLAKPILPMTIGGIEISKTTKSMMIIVVAR
jgi:hypothetical protein